MSNARLVAVLSERPLCLPCLAEKSGLTLTEVDIGLLEVAEEGEVDRCRVCERSDLTYVVKRRA